MEKAAAVLRRFIVKSHARALSGSLENAACGAIEFTGIACGAFSAAFPPATSPLLQAAGEMQTDS
ncbi:MAG TPA: hypothetical protein VKP66_16325 [Steroidobacteraceae bacterium]|nr:hypothetical protein [Steroidobacteraceae bacterium]